CFEVFVAPLRREPYYEFNFSPSCEWAVYRFDSYRSGMSKPDLEPPSIEPMGVGPMFGLITVMNLAPLPELMPWESWRVGLSAVIEAEEGGISYWALMHP